MTEPTRFAATVTAPGMVRTSEGLIRCPDAESLPVGTRLEVTFESTSTGTYAVAVSGDRSFASVNRDLQGNPWGLDRTR